MVLKHSRKLDCHQMRHKRPPRQPSWSPEMLMVTPPPKYWQNLSKRWLTKSALKELNRLNAISSHIAAPEHVSQQELIQQLQALLEKRRIPLVPHPLFDCGPELSLKIKRLSRQGGLDLTDLRGCPIPEAFYYQLIDSHRLSPTGTKRRAESPPQATTMITKRTRTSVYDANFAQHLQDHGIYSPGALCHDQSFPPEPTNLEEILERLSQPRVDSLSKEGIECLFKTFKQADLVADKKSLVTEKIVPLIDGELGQSEGVGGGCFFENLAPLTDGTLISAKPDHFFGACPEHLNRKVLDELNEFIVPTALHQLPIAPNFFLETSSPEGSTAASLRHACYDGAVGARGLHSLRSYKNEDLVYDVKAYTIMSTYGNGVLRLFSMHPIAPKGGREPEYIMTDLNAWCMINMENFRDALTAYRNARDWAKEQRDEIIKAASERYTLFERETASKSMSDT